MLREENKMKQKQKQSQKQTVIVNVGIPKKRGGKRGTKKPSGGRHEAPMVIQQIIPPIPMSVQQTPQPDFASQFIKALASMGEGIPAVKGDKINPLITLNNPNVARETMMMGNETAKPVWKQEEDEFNVKNLRDIQQQMFKAQEAMDGKQEAEKSPYSYSKYGTPELSGTSTPGEDKWNIPQFDFLKEQDAIRIQKAREELGVAQYFPPKPQYFAPAPLLPSQPAQPAISLAIDRPMSSAEAIALNGPPIGLPVASPIPPAEPKKPRGRPPGSKSKPTMEQMKKMDTDQRKRQIENPNA